jgi:hypothetical protein
MDTTNNVTSQALIPPDDEGSNSTRVKGFTLIVLPNEEEGMLLYSIIFSYSSSPVRGPTK